MIEEWGKIGVDYSVGKLEAALLGFWVFTQTTNTSAYSLYVSIFVLPIRLLVATL